MNIAFCDVNQYERKAIEAWTNDPTLREMSISLSEKPIEDLKDYDFDVISIFIDSKVTKDLLDKFTKLKLILTRSAGIDHIDLNECKNRGIIVCNVPDYGSETVAEFTLFLILSLTRKIKKIEKYYEGGTSIEDLRGNCLGGKVIGIMGAGRIGTNVARLAKAFGMKILFFNRSQNKEMTELGGEKVDLDELLANSDVISLHLPLTDATRRIINESNIDRLKASSLLINTARGQLLDTGALIAALKKGAIGGAALDVIEGEEFTNKELEIITHTEDYEKLKEILENSLLKKYDNVILTPHIAYNTTEALQKLISTTLDNVDNFVSGKPLNNTILG